jgi:arylsulfatase A-like enzyme
MHLPDPAVFAIQILRRLLPSLLAALALASPATAQRPPSGERPNIVFIMADDLGTGHLGFNGQTKIRTPNLDRLRAQGRYFSQAYAGCSVCGPSRSTLMTGFHMGHTSVRGNRGGTPLLDEDVTIAEVLKKAGYATGAFGKWGLGDAHTSGMATRQGFDTFFGYYHQVHAHSHYPAYLWRDDTKYFLPGNSGRASDGLTGDGRGQYAHDEIHTKALDFIQANRDRPFFCYVPYVLPHWELLVPEDSLAEYAGKFPEPNPYITPSKHFQDQPQPRAALAAMVTRLDRSVGQIMTLLERLQLDEKTIVFFASDNGAPKGDGTGPDFFAGNRHLRSTKGTLYEGGLRVPLVVRWSGRIPANSSSSHPCYFPDVLPTLAELAGGSRFVPAGIDGISMLPAILGEAQAGRKQAEHAMMYWELTQGPRLQRAVRTGPWKAVWPEAGKPIELYHLERDESETTDVAAQHPEVMEKIRAFLRGCRTEPKPREEPTGTSTWAFR